MGLRATRGGGFITDLKAKLRAYPVTMAQEIAGKAAPALTDLAQASFDGGQNVYGQAIALRGKTGDTEAAIRFAVTGTQIRTPVYPKYFKYLIAKYGVMPNGRAAMPTAWKDKLKTITQDAKPPVAK